MIEFIGIHALVERVLVGEDVTLAGERAPGYADRQRNADMMTAAMHVLGADLAGISRAPACGGYSYWQDGTEMPVPHPRAVSVVIDQGYETMDGASGDAWISSPQSMRTYMRTALPSIALTC